MNKEDSLMNSELLVWLEEKVKEKTKNISWSNMVEGFGGQDSELVPNVSYIKRLFWFH